MSAQQDRFALFLRDRAAVDMIRSVREELFTDHAALDAAMDDGIAPIYQEVVNAAKRGDWLGVALALDRLQEIGVAIGYAFRELEYEEAVRTERVG